MGLIGGGRRVRVVCSVALTLCGAWLLFSAVACAPSSEPSGDASARTAPAPMVAPADDAPRTGKDQVTVLVLNGCGIEGAAAEVAEKLEAEGFANVTVDNATFFASSVTRVSYRSEEQRAEVDEIARLLDVTGRGNVYNYGDTKDWGREYDILVMVGDASVANNPVIVEG